MDPIVLWEFIEELYRTEGARLAALLAEDPDYLRSTEGILEEDRHSDLICTNITNLTQHLVDTAEPVTSQTRTGEDLLGVFRDFLGGLNVAWMSEDKAAWNMVVAQMKKIRRAPVLRALRLAMQDESV